MTTLVQAADITPDDVFRDFGPSANGASFNGAAVEFVRHAGLRFRVEGQAALSWLRSAASLAELRLRLAGTNGSPFDVTGTVVLKTNPAGGPFNESTNKPRHYLFFPPYVDTEIATFVNPRGGPFAHTIYLSTEFVLPVSRDASWDEHLGFVLTSVPGTNPDQVLSVASLEVLPLGFHAADRTLVQEFQAEFGAVEPDVRIFEANEGPPRGGHPEEWVRVNVVHGAATLSEIGGRTSHNFGRLSVQIFVPTGTGTGRARLIADAIAAIFQAQRIGSVSCLETAPVAVVGTSREFPGYWQENVSTRFRFENAPA